MCPSLAANQNADAEAAINPGPENAPDSSASLPSTSFRDGTRKMLAQLVEAGLVDENNFQLWHELKYEQSQVTNDRAHAESFSQIANVIPFMQSLPLPVAIKDGIIREYDRAQLEHADQHPDLYRPGERRFLTRASHLDSRQELVTVYRSRGRVAHQVARLFAGMPLDRFLGREQQAQPLKNEPTRLAGSLLPTFWVNRTGLAGQLEGAEKILTRLYNDDLMCHGKVDLIERRLSELPPEKWLKAAEVLKSLGGLEAKDRPAVLARFRGEFPLSVYPEQRTLVEGRWLAQAHAFGMRTPCCHFKHNREELEEQQSRIEHGKSSAYSLVLHGRVDREFIRWLSGADLNGHDPVPDVEVLYALPLPSGREHRFVLKGARSYTLCESPDINSYPSEDRVLINCLGKYFILPEHKKKLEFLTEFRRADYPTGLHTLIDDPNSIDDIEKYTELRAAWRQSLLLQLSEAASEFDQTFAHLSTTSVPREQDAFIAYCEDRIDRLPDEQRYHEAEYFRLTAEEKACFLREYVPKAFAIMTEDLARAAAEDASVREHRRSLNYNGPEEGYHLPLDHMLMDMIIDLKKKDRYREHIAQQTGVAPESIAVPESVGRSYERADASFPIEELPRVLAELEKNKLFSRQIQMRVFDPLDPDKYSIHPIEGATKLLREISEANRRRFNEAFESVSQGLHLRIKAGIATDAEHTCSLVFRKLWTTTNARIERNLERAQRLEDDRRAEFSSLHENLRARSADKDERAKVFSAVKAEYERRSNALEKAIEADYDKGEFLWHAFMPSTFRMLAIRGHSIIDSRTIKFIYSIGHDGKPRLSPEYPSKKGDRRETHSQQLNGRTMFAGGELILSQHDYIFHTLGAWQGFDQWLKEREAPLAWNARELNNSTGHYLVLSDTLPYAGAIMYPALEAVGISTKHCERVDRLLPGLRLRGAGVYRFL